MKKKDQYNEGAIIPVCEHREECKNSNQVLFYLDACTNCDIAPKFKK